MNALIVWAGLLFSAGALTGNTRLAVVLHAALESSVPAAGDTLTAYPDVVHLTFSEPIELGFSGLTITDGAGKITKLNARIDPHNVDALIADFPHLAPGGYVVTWRVVSADGHPVGGTIPFYMAVGAPGVPAAEVLRGTLPAPTISEDDPSGSPAGLTGEPPVLAAILRGASLTVLLGLAGLLALMAWLVPTDSRRLASIARALAIASPVLLAADFYLWLQHASATGAVDGDTIAAAVTTQAGLIYFARIALALLAIWALLLIQRPGMAAVFATITVLITAATGHPAAIQPLFAIPGKAIHLLGVALWSGGLLILVFGESGERYSDRAHRISTVALISVIAVAGTGVVETFLFMPRFAGLFSSAYGFLVLAKLAGLGGLVAFGAWHKYRALPRLAAGADPGALRRSVSWETGLMSAVMITAAFLAYVSPPPPPGSTPGTMQHHHPTASTAGSEAEP